MAWQDYTEITLQNDARKMTHPKHMVPFACYNANIWSGIYNGGDFNTTEATFWTHMGEAGVAVDTNFSAGVAKEILASSTPGELMAVVGPQAGGAETTTFTLVIDGVTYTFPAITLASTMRAGLVNALSLYTSAANNSFANGSFMFSTPGWNGSKTVASPHDVGIPTHMTPYTYFAPLLRYNTISVSVTHSANVTGTGSFERQSAVTYRSFPVVT